MYHFEISGKELKAGMLPALEDFVDPRTQDGLVAEVKNLTLDGAEEAYYVPAVSLVVQSTLGVMEQPSMQARMPREILFRSNIATHAAMKYAHLAINMGIFTAYYTANPDLARLSKAKALFRSLADKEYISSLGAAPFCDARIVIGGAFNFLDASGVPSAERKDIIANSPALLAISGVYKGYAPKAVAHLGTPYAKAERYVLDETEDKPKVAYTDSTREFLQSLNIRGRGCPAGKINLLDRATATEYNLLHRNWIRIVGALIPEDAYIA